MIAAVVGIMNEELGPTDLGGDRQEREFHSGPRRDRRRPEPHDHRAGPFARGGARECPTGNSRRLAPCGTTQGQTANFDRILGAMVLRKVNVQIGGALCLRAIVTEGSSTAGCRDTAEDLRRTVVDGMT